LKKVVIIHREYLNTYHNKEMGHFIKYAISKGLKVDFLTLQGRAEEYDGRSGNEFEVIEVPCKRFGSLRGLIYLFSFVKSYEYAWIYPFHKNLLWILFVLWLKDVKTILILDGYYFVPKSAGWFRRLRKGFRALFVHGFCKYIFYASSELISSFWKQEKMIRYSAGLPTETIETINKISASTSRQKKILYPGLIMPVKGLDRLINSFLHLLEETRIDQSWKLEAIGRVSDEAYFASIKEKTETSKFKDRIIFNKEQRGEDYYKKILESSLVVMPSRKEGMPNVLQDAYFSRRLFCQAI